MALTKELLTANEGLSSLTDEQIETIVTLSANDENSVIGERTGKMYGDLDSDISAASGIEKNAGERTFDYMKRVISQFKETAGQVEGLNGQIAALSREKSRLEKSLAEGAADAETAKQLKQAKADLASVTKQYADQTAQFEAAKSKFNADLLNVRIDNEFEKAKTGIRFKQGFNEEVKAVLLRNAVDSLKAKNPQYEDDGKGGERLVFMENGATLRNEKNAMNPYTASELLERELDAMQVLDHGLQQKGSGSKHDLPNAQSASSVDLGGAKTQTEAMEMLHTSLMSQGIAAGSKDYQEKVDKAWKDFNVGSLPIR